MMANGWKGRNGTDSAAERSNSAPWDQSRNLRGNNTKKLDSSRLEWWKTHRLHFRWDIPSIWWGPGNFQGVRHPRHSYLGKKYCENKLASPPWWIRRLARFFNDYCSNKCKKEGKYSPASLGIGSISCFSSAKEKLECCKSRNSKV